MIATQRGRSSTATCFTAQEEEAPRKRKRGGTPAEEGGDDDDEEGAPKSRWRPPAGARAGVQPGGPLRTESGPGSLPLAGSSDDEGEQGSGDEEEEEIDDDQEFPEEAEVDEAELLRLDAQPVTVEDPRTPEQVVVGGLGAAVAAGGAATLQWLISPVEVKSFEEAVEEEAPLLVQRPHLGEYYSGIFGSDGEQTAVAAGAAGAGAAGRGWRRPLPTRRPIVARLYFRGPGAGHLRDHDRFPCP
jgi:hypothetical protein